MRRSGGQSLYFSANVALTVAVMVFSRLSRLSFPSQEVALLCSGRRVRDSEFGDGARAGFCLMGACQDCWVRDGAGRRVRACTTPAVDGMDIVTRAPDATWPRRQP